MTINIAFLPHFLKEAKRFSKKYKTFKVALADIWLVDIYDKSEKEDMPKKILQEYVKDILL